jgi:AcrR family transcriptional regulator
MPRPRKTAEELGAMRDRILNVAYELLVAKGTEGLSMRAIAERLPVAHMTLYTYFASQGELLQSLAERELAKAAAQQQELERAAEGQGIHVVMRAALSFFAEFEKSSPHSFHLALVLPEQNPISMEQAQRRIGGFVKHFEQLVEVGMAQGVFSQRPARLAATIILGIVTFPLIMYHNGRIPQDNTGLRDLLAHEAIEAAMIYLAHNDQPAQGDDHATG